MLRSIDVAAHAGTAFDGEHLFQIAEDRIQKIDPKTGRVLATIPAPGGGGDSGLAWAEGTLWVGQYRDRKIHQVDPDTGAILRTIESNRFVTGVTWVDGELWHATWEGDESDVRRIDPRTGEVLERLEMPPGVRRVGTRVRRRRSVLLRRRTKRQGQSGTPAQATIGGATMIAHARKAVAGGWVGSALEYYDFFIYATAASLVFPQIFFPSDNPTVAIVASLATYGVGYVARPVGAFVLGHWGDTHGRKQVLVGCMILMGVSTMAVGLLPTYEQAGVLAPTLLVVLRLIQGFAVAGEISGSSSMILEHAPFGHRGLYSSFTLQGVQAGQIFAAAVFLPLARYLPRDAFMAWGWRVPFLFSALAVAAGYVIRRRVAETPVFAEQHARGTMARAPVVQAFTDSGARHAARDVHGTDERHPCRHHDLRRGLRRAAWLRHRDA